MAHQPALGRSVFVVDVQGGGGGRGPVCPPCATSRGSRDARAVALQPQLLAGRQWSLRGRAGDQGTRYSLPAERALRPEGVQETGERERDDEVEQPAGRGRERHSQLAHVKREHLGAVRERNGTLAKRVRNRVQVDARRDEADARGRRLGDPASMSACVLPGLRGPRQHGQRHSQAKSCEQQQ